MKISMKWMVLVGLLSASVACGDSIDKKTPVIDVDSSMNNSNNVVDGPGDEPGENNGREPDPTNNANNEEPSNNANNEEPANNLNNANNEGPTNNANNEVPVNNANNVNNENPENPNEFRPIHVQLVWSTPADEDETDEVGTDLDIHVAHPLAAEDASQPDQDLDGKPDPWFHPTFDCSWRNNSPDWGSAGPAHNPTQDIDDLNGQGPENINIAMPEDVDYRIGAHYYAASGLGQSVAFVKVFVGGELVAEFDNGLAELDMWEIATIDGRTGVVTPVGKLTQDYQVN